MLEGLVNVCTNTFSAYSGSPAPLLLRILCYQDAKPVDHCWKPTIQNDHSWFHFLILYLQSHIYFVTTLSHITTWKVSWNDFSEIPTISREATSLTDLSNNSFIPLWINLFKKILETLEDFLILAVLSVYLSLPTTLAFNRPLCSRCAHQYCSPTIKSQTIN